MSNTTSGGYETLISKMVQKYLTKKPVFRKLASFAENNTLSKGVSVNRPYRNDFVGYASDYTANTDVTAKDWVVTASDLTIDQSKAISIKVDPVENKQLQTKEGKSLFAQRLTYTLSDLMDQDFLAEVDNAALDVDYGDFGGTAAAPIPLSAVEAERVLGLAQAEIQGNTQEGDLYTVIDPFIANEICQRGLATTFTKSDMLFNNGFAKGGFLGLDTYISNNLPSTATFTFTDTGTNGKSITINGITFNLVTTIGTTAGNVLMETNAATCATNLAALINTPGTTTAKGVALSQANQDKLARAGIAADASAADGTVVITSCGRMTLSEDETNGSWGDQTVKVMVGQYGAIDMVAQMQPTIQINKATDNLGSTILAHALWGTKTFEDGAQRLLKLSIKG